MKNQHIEAFERWWGRTNFREHLRSWGSREGLGEADAQSLPGSPKRLARAAWNAAWHILGKQADARVKAERQHADDRVDTVLAQLERAKVEIDALERRHPLPEDEFDARLLVARNYALEARVKELTGRDPASNDGPAHTYALRSAIQVAEQARAETKRAEECARESAAARDAFQRQVCDERQRVRDLEGALRHVQQRYDDLVATLRNDADSPMAMRREVAAALRSIADGIEKV